MDACDLLGFLEVSTNIHMCLMRCVCAIECHHVQDAGVDVGYPEDTSHTNKYDKRIREMTNSGIRRR